jgi:hypothetical protein
MKILMGLELNKGCIKFADSLRVKYKEYLTKKVIIKKLMI